MKAWSARITSLMAALLLITCSLAPLPALARGNPNPRGIYATDGTPEGTFCGVYWDACGGTEWEVCAKGASMEPIFGDDGQSIVYPTCPCEIIYNPGFVVWMGEPVRYAIRWIDGEYAGQIFYYTVKWPPLQ